MLIVNVLLVFLQHLQLDDVLDLLVHLFLTALLGLLLQVVLLVLHPYELDVTVVLTLVLLLLLLSEHDLVVEDLSLLLVLVAQELLMLSIHHLSLFVTFEDVLHLFLVATFLVVVVLLNQAAHAIYFLFDPSFTICPLLGTFAILFLLNADVLFHQLDSVLLLQLGKLLRFKSFGLVVHVDRFRFFDLGLLAFHLFPFLLIELCLELGDLHDLSLSLPLLILHLLMADRLQDLLLVFLLLEGLSLLFLLLLFLLKQLPLSIIKVIPINLIHLRLYLVFVILLVPHLVI